MEATGSPALADRLRTLLLEELAEHVAALNRGLVAIELEGAAPATVQLLFRSAHSLKGAAAAAGSREVERLCHRMEDLLGAARTEPGRLGPEALAELFAGVDRLAAEGERLQAGPDRGPEPPTPTAAAAPTPTVLRLPAKRLDRLLDQAGALVTATRRVSGLAGLVEEARARAEPASAVAGALDELARSAAAADRHLRQAGDELLEAAHLVRLLPFDRALDGVERLVHDLAAQLGKRARVEVEGATTELDRAVLEAARDPLLHLVRNAVGHGIEPPAERVRAGKPPVGTVRITAALLGGAVTVTVADDGTGVDPAAVRAAVERQGLPPPAGAEEVFEALFAPGLSTALEPSAIAGRGVGLDVVRSSVEALGGEVRLESASGAGTSVALVLPVSISAVEAVLAETCGETVALTATGVPTRARPGDPRLGVVEGRPALSFGDTVAPIVPLAAVLGLAPRPAETTGPVQAMVAGPAGGTVALAVDRFLGQQAMVVRPLGERLDQLPGVLGGSILADGRPVLVLNTAALARLALAHLAGAPAPPRAESRGRVLVVDDSLTIRALEQGMLEAAGYEVETAADGAAALARLREHGADVVVADVDMPVMSGLELCRALRASERFVDTPLVLVTALESDEDRRRGLEAGADAYLVKSAFDPAELLRVLERLR